MNFKEVCFDIVMNMYQLDSIEDIHPAVRKRLNDELEIIKFKEYEDNFVAAQLLLRADDMRRFMSLGSTAALFTAYLLGLSNTNPLPPHYYCENCGYIEFIEDSSVKNGLDLAASVCPHCGESMHGDGHDLNYHEFFLSPFKMSFAVPAHYYYGGFLQNSFNTIQHNPFLAFNSDIEICPVFSVPEFGITFQPSSALTHLTALIESTGTVCYNRGSYLLASDRLYSDEFEKYKKISGISQTDAELAERFDIVLQLDFFRRSFPEYYEKIIEKEIF